MGMKSSRLYITHLVMSVLPPTRCFMLKRCMLRWSGARVGENVRIVSSARFYLTGNLIIGKGTWIGHEVLMVGGDANIVIGDNVDIAPRTSLITGSHELFSSPLRAAGKGYSLPINVGDGVWIGACSTVLGGIRLGSCSVIGANSLVNKDVPERSVYGGVPAKSLKPSCRESLL